MRTRLVALLAINALLFGVGAGTNVGAAEAVPDGCCRVSTAGEGFCCDNASCTCTGGYCHYDESCPSSCEISGDCPPA